jgi:hypothetical protein
MDIRLVLPHHIKVIASCWSTFLKEGRTISELARTYFKTLLHYPIRLSRSVVISFQLSTTNPNHIDDAPVKRLLPDIYETRYRSLFIPSNFSKQLHVLVCTKLLPISSGRISLKRFNIITNPSNMIRTSRSVCYASAAKNPLFEIAFKTLTSRPIQSTPLCRLPAHQALALLPVLLLLRLSARRFHLLAFP